MPNFGTPAARNTISRFGFEARGTEPPLSLAWPAVKGRMASQTDFFGMAAVPDLTHGPGSSPAVIWLPLWGAVVFKNVIPQSDSCWFG